jgi:hypothetical protein
MKTHAHHQEPTVYLIDLTCNCNCYEGTEEECKAEIDNLVNNYGHDRARYAISFNRFD